MAKISVAELANAVSAKFGIPQEHAETFVSEFFEVINDGLHTDKSVKVRGLGTFKVVDVRERESVNVNTGERVTIEGHGKVSYTPDPVMRDLVNKPFAKFETVVLNDGVDVDELNSVSDTPATDNIDDEADEAADFTDVVEDDVKPEADEPKEAEPKNAIADVIGAWKEALEENVETDEDTHLDGGSIAVEAEVENVGPVEAIFTKPETKAVVIERPVEAEVKEEPVQELVVEDDVEDEPEGETVICSCGRIRVVIITVGVLLLLVVAFAGGYLFGQSMASRPVFKTVKVVRVMQKASVQTDKSVADTVANKIDDKKENVATDNNTQDKSSLENIAETEKEKDKPADKKTNTVAPESAQRQVKTGAYVITGTSQMVTVRKGQTLQSLSRYFLGSGMECYIQVHNGISDIKEGMKIKIPQLKLKKR